MSYLTIHKVKIAGLSACVPPDIEENLTLPVFENEEEARKVIASTGIARKRVVRPGTTSSDLSVPAIERLLGSLGWMPDSIDCFFFRQPDTGLHCPDYLGDFARQARVSQ